MVGIASQGGSGNSNVQAGIASGSQSGSPVEESSFLHTETSIEELEDKDKVVDKANDNVGLLPAKDGVPIGREARTRGFRRLVWEL
jgi:hypothetical protein